MAWPTRIDNFAPALRHDDCEVYRTPLDQTLEQPTFEPPDIDVVGHFDKPKRCQFFDTMEDLLALEEYMRWAYDIGRIAVIDGDVWRQNYYAGLVSSVRLDHSFLMDEYWKLSEAFPQPLRRRWLNDQAFSFPGIAELDSWEAKREPGREWEQLNREGFTECDWFPTLEPHQEHLHGIGPACECAVLREIVLRSHDFEQVSHLRAEDGDHWKSYFVTYKSFKGT